MSSKAAKKSEFKSRSWCFTLNNYSPEEELLVRALKEHNTKYFVFGKEVGERPAEGRALVPSGRARINFNLILNHDSIPKEPDKAIEL